MDWFDVVIIAIPIVSDILGMSIGLLGARIAALGVFVGWLLAGRFAHDLAPLFGALVSEVWAVVISYAIIMVLALAVAGMVKSIVLPALSSATFGLSNLLDRAGGLLMGLVIGLLIVGAILAGPKVSVIYL